MKNKATWLMFLVLVCSLASCRKPESVQAGTAQAATGTMAPATATPAPTGTDAMTQTVEVDDSRSEAEGGSINQTDTATTSKPAAKNAKPTPKKKH